MKFYIRELGLEKLYLDNKSLILSLFKDYESSIQTKIKDTCILKNIIQFFDCIVQKYPSNILINSLYLYARDFVMYLMSDKKDAKLASYSFDIKSALSGIYKKGTTYVRFFYDTKQDKYRSSIISSTKLLYYIINNLT